MCDLRNLRIAQLLPYGDCGELCGCASSALQTPGEVLVTTRTQIPNPRPPRPQDAQALALEVATALLETLEPEEMLSRLVVVVRAALGLPWVRAVLHTESGPLEIASGRDAPRRLRTAVPLTLGERPMGLLELPALGDRAEIVAALDQALPIAARALANALAHRHMVQLAMTDCLTGLGTRRLFEDALAREQRARRRERRPHAIVVIDVDRFKHVNDRFGHPVGDDVLRALGRAIEGAVRRGDVVCRLGGDELCVLLLDEHGADGARGVAERIRQAASVVRLPDGGAVTLSIGVAKNTLERWVDAACLLETADGAAYAAKRAGGDAVVERDPDHARGGGSLRRMVA